MAFAAIGAMKVSQSISTLATQMLWVTYQGAQQTSQALFNGDLDLSISASVPYASYIKEGRMLGLATTSPKREPRVPDMPSMSWP